MTQVNNTMDGFVTGVGRLVQGSPYEKQTLDHENKPLPPEKQKYFVGVAFDKTQDAITGFPGIWAIMQQAAATHPNAAQFQAQNWNGFKFKMEDGDAPQHATKPGFKGHWVLKFSNGFAPGILDENMNDVSQQPEAVYKGCYVRIVGSAKQNKASGAQAGIFLNFGTIQRVAHGERIQTGPDHRAMLAGAGPVALPPGASSIPQATGTIPGAPGAPSAPAGISLPGLPGAGAPVAGGAPALPSAPPAPPAQVDKQSLMNNGLDYAQCIAQGWTDESLVANGHMRPVPVAAPSPVAGIPNGGVPGVPAGIPAGGVPVSNLPQGVPAGLPAVGLPGGVPGATHHYAQ